MAISQQYGNLEDRSHNGSHTDVTWKSKKGEYTWVID